MDLPYIYSTKGVLQDGTQVNGPADLRNWLTGPAREAFVAADETATGIKQKLGNLWFWFGSQGYEYVDLGRAWQIALFGGLCYWLWLMWRGIRPALARLPTENGAAAMRAVNVLAVRPPLMVLMFSAISLVYQFWIHTEVIGRMGPLEWVMNTPSHHRVHHGSNEQYLDRNYGGILVIWDRLFGTYSDGDVEQTGIGPRQPSVWEMLRMPWREPGDVDTAASRARSPRGSTAAARCAPSKRGSPACGS